jgi:hypothetical protein
VISNDEKDLMARTIAAENQHGAPDEQSAIAHVMLNRLNGGKYGNTMRGVLLAPKQFSPFNPGSNNSPYDVNSASPVYKSALDAVNKAAGGQDNDPTNGAMFYANPDRVKGKQPAFMKLPAQKIGAHTFYGGQQQAANDDEINSIVNEHYPAAGGGGGGQSPSDADVNAIVNEHYGVPPTPMAPNAVVKQDFAAARANPMEQFGNNFFGGNSRTGRPATLLDLINSPSRASVAGGALLAGPGTWPLVGAAIGATWPLIKHTAEIALGTQLGQHLDEATMGYGSKLLDMVKGTVP